MLDPYGKPIKLENKYKLFASISDKFECITNNKVYTYYHLVLENDNDNKSYGIYVNNILTESICKKHFIYQEYTLLI